MTANNSGAGVATPRTARPTSAPGGALASGNVSATTLTQHQTSDVTDMGLVIGTQVGGVANVGVGIANSGLNAAVGNASTNSATATQDGAVRLR